MVLSGASLEQRRKESPDSKYAEALRRLKKRADGLVVSAKTYSVTNKTMTPPSGDKHDYMSQAPYWWPDAARPGGLPYVRRDGERNPELSKISDSEEMDRMPALFIGSSSEGLAVAQAIQTQLQHDTEVTVWNEGTFPLGQTALEGLVNALDRFDFAVLVLTPDDTVLTRKSEHLAPRDNLLFELGLFMGRLGRSRTFVVCERFLQNEIAL